MSLHDDIGALIDRCVAQGYELQIDQIPTTPLRMGGKVTGYTLTSVQKPTLMQLEARADAAHVVMFDRNNPDHMRQARNAAELVTGSELDVLARDVFDIERRGSARGAFLESDASLRYRILRHDL